MAQNGSASFKIGRYGRGRDGFAAPRGTHLTNQGAIAVETEGNPSELEAVPCAETLKRQFEPRICYIIDFETAAPHPPVRLTITRSAAARKRRPLQHDVGRTPDHGRAGTRRTEHAQPDQGRKCVDFMRA